MELCIYVCIYVYSSFLHPLRQRIAPLRSAKLFLVLISFLCRIMIRSVFRFNLFFAGFWKFFVEPGVLLQFTQKISGKKAAVFHIQNSQGYHKFYTSLTGIISIHLWRSVESGFLRTVVHMRMYAECLVVPLDISDKDHL